MLIATAFTLSYKEPVILLTRDNGILNMAERTDMILSNRNRRKNYDIKESPTNVIEIFNPNFEGRTFLEARKLLIDALKRTIS